MAVETPRPAKEQCLSEAVPLIGSVKTVYVFVPSSIVSVRDELAAVAIIKLARTSKRRSESALSFVNESVYEVANAAGVVVATVAEPMAALAP